MSFFNVMETAKDIFSVGKKGKEVNILKDFRGVTNPGARESLQYRVFVIFQVTVLPALILAQVEPKYALSRMIYYREASSKMYGQFAFASSLVVAGLPYSILCAVGFFLPLYYMPGFQ